LRRKAEFERLLREGARRSANGYTFYLARRDAGGARLGILVSRRHARGAAVRNRIKRCIREAFRLEQETLGPLDLLVRPPYGIKPTAKMIAQLRTLFTQLTSR
jgi:ribonuclease P protein component